MTSAAGDGGFDFYSRFKDSYESELKKLGKFNLAVFGNTGVGKSSLINGIFGRVVAKTGIGKPVTKGIDYYEHPSGIFGVFDCEGYETGKAGDTILQEMRTLVEGKRRLPLAEQIHVAWYVVRWSDRRFEDSQAQFVRQLHQLGLPVIVVLTQVPLLSEGQPHPDAAELAAVIADELKDVIVGGSPIFSNSVADVHLAQPVHGLDPLLEATFRAAPEGVRAALTAAQKIDLHRKREACKPIITAGALSAAGVGATPIPFSDAVLLIPVQVTMMAAISGKYALPVDSGTVATLAGSAAFAGGATYVGRALANLIKFIPGAGSVVGGTINAAIASTLTTAVGWAWVAVCDYLVRLDPEALDALLGNKSILVKLFMDAFRGYLSGQKPELST